jgi:hypothetical protein
MPISGILEGNYDIFLANAKEPADAYDRGRHVAVAVDHKIGDIADFVFGRITNICLIDIGGEQLVRRRRIDIWPKYSTRSFAVGLCTMVVTTNRHFPEC